MRPDDLLTIQMIVKRSGLPASALRYYEERGLISSTRAGSNHRRYQRSVLRRLAFIVFAQRLGLTLEEIAGELSRLPSDHVPSGRDWARLSERWTVRIDARIAELERLKIGLSECISCGCLSLGTCRFVNPKDRAAVQGPGPRYWVGEGSSCEAECDEAPGGRTPSRRTGGK